jgi:hypothetical protein
MTAPSGFGAGSWGAGAFGTLDTAPLVKRIQAIASNVVRVYLDRNVLAVEPSGPFDALNADNWTIALIAGAYAPPIAKIAPVYQAGTVIQLFDRVDLYFVSPLRPSVTVDISPNATIASL